MGGVGVCLCCKLTYLDLAQVYLVSNLREKRGDQESREGMKSSPFSQHLPSTHKNNNTQTSERAMLSSNFAQIKTAHMLEEVTAIAGLLIAKKREESSS